MSNLNLQEIYATIEDCKKADMQTIKIKSQDRSVYLHSRYDPVKEANDAIHKLGIKSKSIILVFGIGLGYYIDAMLEKISDENNKIIAIEPSSGVSKLTTEKLIKKYKKHKNVKLFFVEDKYDGYAIENFMQSQIDAYRNSDVIVFSPSIYKDFFLYEYKMFMEAYKKATYTGTTNSATALMFASILQRAIINNTTTLQKVSKIDDFFDRFKGVPGISVAGGPSLDKNVHLLKEIKGKAFIIAVDTVVPKLLSLDIIPDIMISIDPQPIVYNKVKGSDYSRIPMIYSLTSSVEIVENHTGDKVIYISTEATLAKYLEEKDKKVSQLEVGGSVACSAFDVLVKLGCDPVVMIGQDLAFTNNLSHATGSFYREDYNSIEFDTFTEDNNGNLIPTSKNFNVYRSWFEQYINLRKGPMYINATEGGAKITGATVMTLKEVIDKYCKEEHNITQIISETLDMPPLFDRDEFLEYIKSILRERDLLLDLEPSLEYGIETAKKFEKLYKHNPRPKITEINRINRKLDDVDNKIKKVIKKALLASQILQLLLIELAYYVDLDDLEYQEKGLKIAKKSQAIYEHMLNSTKLVDKYINDLTENMLEGGIITQSDLDQIQKSLDMEE